MSRASESLTSETFTTAFPPLANTDGHMTDDASALPESASGGDGCSSGDQQGLVLPFGRDPILICLTHSFYTAAGARLPANSALPTLRTTEPERPAVGQSHDE